MKKKAEILAPAGTWEAMLAAVAGGADAVYMGAEKFNARIVADNFDGEALGRAIAYCHAHGVAVYVTMNTLLYDRELDEAMRMAQYASDAGADALIVADMGLLTMLRRRLPQIPIHVSTQATVHSSDGVKEMMRLGAERVVLARELSEKNLRLLMKNIEGLPIETEIFVHGAHCVSVSGQCLFSSLVGGRSGNRGECAQPCRLPYCDGYPLSLKDLSLAFDVPALMEMGVDSFKIEGRLKSPYYVYTATRIFRRLVDESRAATEKEMQALAAAFSRGGGFTDGYFKGNHACMTGIRTEGDKESTRRAEMGYEPIEKKAKVALHFTAKKDQPIRLTLEGEVGKVDVDGCIPRPALQAPLTPEAAKARLTKLGDTPLEADLAASSFEVEGGLFLPVSALNELRRTACRKLLSVPLRAHREAREETVGEKDEIRYEEIVSRADGGERAVLVLAYSRAQLNAAFSFFADRAEKPLFFASYEAMTEAGQMTYIPDGVCLPPLVYDDEKEDVLALLLEFKKRGVRFVMVDNVGGYALASEAQMPVFGGMRLNLTNRLASARLLQKGACGGILSPELNLAQIKDIDFGIPVIYGRLPLMLTERCFIRDVYGCDSCGGAYLTDRRGVKFPILRSYRHRNIVVNSRPTYMFDKLSELQRKGIMGGVILLTVESAEETRLVLQSFLEKAEPVQDIRRIK